MTWRAKAVCRCLISTGPWCHGAVAAWRAARNRGIACRVHQRQPATPRRFVGFSDNKQALRRRFYRASSLSLQFLRILRCFYKALKYSKIWKNRIFCSLSKRYFDEKFSREFLVISVVWFGHLAFLIAWKGLFDQVNSRFSLWNGRFLVSSSSFFLIFNSRSSLEWRKMLTEFC